MIDHRQQCARMASYFSLVQTIYVLFSALLACIFSTPLAQGVLQVGYRLLYRKMLPDISLLATNTSIHTLFFKNVPRLCS